MGSTGTVLRELRGAQKSAKGVSLYSRYVNRPAGRVLAAGAYRAGLSPNQVTLISALFTYGAVASVALVEPSWTLAVLVYAALAVGFAFDSADGQVAAATAEAPPPLAPTTESRRSLTTDEPLVDDDARDDLRRELMQSFLARGYPQNEPLLQEMFGLRHELAGLVGYDSWPSYDVAVKMIGAGSAIPEFIDRIAEVSPFCAQFDQPRDLGVASCERPLPWVENPGSHGRFHALGDVDWFAHPRDDCLELVDLCRRGDALVGDGEEMDGMKFGHQLTSVVRRRRELIAQLVEIALVRGQVRVLDEVDL